ncbi:MAG: amidohydrolase [Thermoguttaceae bacterium]|jgi:amidohydrolase|nr:amidohydrolase [Thermoguttaceae bacterium]
MTCRISGIAVLLTLLTLYPVSTAAAELESKVDALVEAVTPEVIHWRRDIHAHPELANREERTGRVIAEALRAMRPDHLQTGVAHHGVVAIIRGAHPGPTVALRADIDALPVQEQTGLPFASKVPGVMHACGHDAHTAMLLGAAAVLGQLREELHGTVKLIFQPAEEGVPPGEEGGATMMIAEGVLADPDVEAIFAMHVNPGLPTGKLAYRLGGLMAAVDRFKLTVTGKQSHAAMPWEGMDPIVTSAHIITAAQTVASRTIDAREPVVVSFCTVRAGEAWNIIPEKVVLEGTIRTHDMAVRRQAVGHFEQVVRSTAAAHGVGVELDVNQLVPVTWNDPELTKRMLPTLRRVAGEHNVVETEPFMGGEDFAHYAAEIPGLYFFLGVHDEQAGPSYGLHHPKMTVDEAALPIGVKAHVLLAIEYLRSVQTDTGQ